MARIVVLGIAGEEGLWIADLDAGTVVGAEAPAGGDLKAADELRKAGATIVKGVNLAALASSADAASGGFLDVSGGFLDN